MDDVTAFHDHLDKCERCAEQPFNLCPTGEALLLRAGAPDAVPTPPTAPPRERESEPTIGEPGTLVTFSSPDLLAAASLPPSAEARDLCLGRSPGAGAYACTRKRGHDGEHRNGVTSWDAPPPAGSGETEP